MVTSLGLSRVSSTNSMDAILFVLASLLAAGVIAIAIYVCFAYADRVQRLLPVALISRYGSPRSFSFVSEFNFWSGGSELLRSVIHSGL